MTVEHVNVAMGTATAPKTATPVSQTAVPARVETTNALAVKLVRIVPKIVMHAHVEMVHVKAQKTVRTARPIAVNALVAMDNALATNTAGIVLKIVRASAEMVHVKAQKAAQIAPKIVAHWMGSNAALLARRAKRRLIASITMRVFQHKGTILTYWAQPWAMAYV